MDMEHQHAGCDRARVPDGSDAGPSFELCPGTVGICTDRFPTPSSSASCKTHWTTRGDIERLSDPIRRV